MSSKTKSLKSHPLFRLQQRRHVSKGSVTPDNQIYNKMRQPYPQNCDKYENHSTRSNRWKARSNAVLKRTGSLGRRNSLNGNISLTERLKNYQKETRKQKDKSLHRNRYQEKVPIKKLIQTIGNKLANKPQQVEKYKHCAGKPLRIDTPERAKELVRRYFNNPNPKPIGQNPTHHYPTGNS